MKEKVTAIFDIGKTNKKLLLFNYDLEVVSEIEEKFDQITDDDGFECEDIEKIESWILKSIRDLVHSDIYDLTSVNFATYGATLAYLNEEGKRITPIYNYLKPIDEKIPERIYRKNGGQDEFCRRTASPALGMLNSGIQAYWLKSEKPEVFRNVRHILHFPQYLSYLLTGKIYSEHTSIGCHTAMWDFDLMNYHPWLEKEGIILPEPVPVDTVNEVEIDGKKIVVGIGIHDSSSSLAPYFGSDWKFLLLSTGTWCINMNPFNNEKLTTWELDNDCLCYISINCQPVKSSRLFLGHLHETGVNIINKHFGAEPDKYESVKPDLQIEKRLKDKFGSNRFFIKSGPYSREFKDKIDLFDFGTFEEAYHQLMRELGELTVEAVDLVMPDIDETENIYITGGFSKNLLFPRIISNAYPSKRVYTSIVNNATALGAVLVITGKLNPEKQLELNLGLTLC
jgi:sugar (pentulose or hexulose) kinase